MLLIVSSIILAIALSITDKSISVVGSSKTISRTPMFLIRWICCMVSYLFLPSLSNSVTIKISPGRRTSSTKTVYLGRLKFFPVSWSVKIFVSAISCSLQYRSISCMPRSICCSFVLVRWYPYICIHISPFPVPKYPHFCWHISKLCV